MIGRNISLTSPGSHDIIATVDVILKFFNAHCLSLWYSQVAINTSISESGFKVSLPTEHKEDKTVK